MESSLLKLEYRILIIIFLINTIGSCQSQKGIFDIESPKGFIVRKDIELYQNDKVSWFKPTLEEVIEAEGILKKQIVDLNNDKVNQKNGCPIIHKNLRKYIRQYIGYKNKEGSRIILVNMLWGKDLKAIEIMRDEYRLIMDGCSYYWRVKVDLDNKKLFDMDINGSA